MKKYKNRFDLLGFSREMQYTRNQRGWSQEHAFEVLSISYDYYVKIENRKTQPSIGVLCVIADEYDISIDSYVIAASSQKKKVKDSNTKQIEKMLTLCDEEIVKAIRIIVEALSKK